MSGLNVNNVEIIDNDGMIDWSKINHPHIPTNAQDSLIEVAKLRSDLDIYKASIVGQTDSIIPVSRIDSKTYSKEKTPVSPAYALSYILSKKLMPSASSSVLGGIKTTSVGFDLDID